MQRPQRPVSVALGAPGSTGSTQNTAGGPVLNGGALPAPAGMRPQTDPGIEGILASINDIKNLIVSFLQHIEMQPDSLSWPIILDRFNTISSQLVTLSNAMKSSRIPDLRKLCIVPFYVNPDPDPAVERLTEGRMSTVNHENASNYLRTKLDPDVETRFEQAYSKVPPMNSTPDVIHKAEKQIQSLNKIVSALIEQVTTAINETDSKAGKTKLQATYDPNDTALLLAAVMAGKGLPGLPTAPPPGGHAPQKFSGFPGPTPSLQPGQR